jgi:hypothetical protein
MEADWWENWEGILGVNTTLWEGGVKNTYIRGKITELHSTKRVLPVRIKNLEEASLYVKSSLLKLLYLSANTGRMIPFSFL